MSSIDEHKKRGPGRPKVESDMVRARVAQPLLGALDVHVADHNAMHPDQPISRADVIREALAAYLVRPSQH